MKNFLFALLLCLVSIGVKAEGRFDAVVDAGIVGQPGASVDGPPVFATITGALEAAPAADGGPYRLFIREGVYREKLVITRPDVSLVGADRDGTLISWNDTGSTLGPDGEELGTWGSATLIVRAPGFQVENLTIENAFDYTANAALADDDPQKVQRMQAVAVMTTADSDRAVFERVSITGYQDTLFVDAGRHYFNDCRISGHVDFIFGAGTAVFEECEIVSRHRPNKDPSGYVTAPSTHVANPYGLVFVNSRFLKESSEVVDDSVRLGRPWHPGGDPSAEGSAVFIDCFMDAHIGPEGYAPISGVGPDGKRIWFEVDERSRFFEYGSHGPGGAASAQRPQLTAERAEWYTPAQVLNGWNPDGD